MPKLITNLRFPAVLFSTPEQNSFADYSRIILEKKRDKGRFGDRITSEMGEAAVDSLMESMDMHRIWCRGRFHFDFANADYSTRVEVKTRKHYARELDDLDVRLDLAELENAKEATHICPLIYDETPVGYQIISPGFFPVKTFMEGCRKANFPDDPRLKAPCFRVPWGYVFSQPKTFGYLTWKDFRKNW